jgi:ribonuclease BN (tRNA processing enzyme)
MRSGTHYTQISHLFLSHLHVDHAAGVPPLFQALALDPSSRPLKIFGPPGTSAFCDAIIKILFPSLEEYVSFEVTEVEEGLVVAGSDWQVICTMAQHFRVKAIAYRFELGEKNCVYSGDTAPCESLRRLATETNLLVHECSFMDNAPEDQLRGHSTPSQVAEIARAGRVKRLCLTHFYPEVARRTREVFQLVRAKFAGEVLIAQDLLQLKL